MAKKQPEKMALIRYANQGRNTYKGISTLILSAKVFLLPVSSLIEKL